jgi:hypothetical protein
MSDKTIPMRGGWVMITRKLPPMQPDIQVPLLSMFYAMPDRLFPQGWHTAGWGGLTEGSEVSGSDLSILYKWRNGSKALLPQDVETAEKLDRKGIELDQRVRIMAPAGEVSIEPYEWVPIPDISKYFDAVGNGIILHEYAVQAKQTSRMEDQIFYMQTRGLSRHEAMTLLLGEVRKPNVVWMQAEDAYVDFFFGKRERKRTVSDPMELEIVDDRDQDRVVL